MAEPLVCAGCALLCDDATAELSGGQARLQPSCRLGAEWLSARVAVASGAPPATIDGRPVERETALARAAELLRAASRPLLHGFGAATVEDARAAVALADRIGAIVAPQRVDGPWPGAQALGLRGAATASLGEVRDRAGLVVIWREDPELTHPRLLDRLGFGAGARASRPGGERTLVVVDDRDTATARRADVRLSWSPDRDLEALRWLLASRRGVAGGAEPFASELGERLAAASHTAVVHGAGLIAGAGGERRALALHDLIRVLNADRQAVTLALGAAPGTRSVQDVLAWQTGYSTPVDLASGHPELVTATRDLVAAESIDVALSIEGRLGPPLPGVTEIALSALPVADAAVSIRTASAGIEVSGTAHRLDGVPLALHAPRPADVPTAAALLARLGEELARSRTTHAADFQARPDDERRRSA